MTLNDYKGQSPVLALTGEGMLNLADQTCDTQFDIRVVGGWNGESKLIDFLKETPVPLRVYGNWQQLQLQPASGSVTAQTSTGRSETSPE